MAAETRTASTAGGEGMGIPNNYIISCLPAPTAEGESLRIAVNRIRQALIGRYRDGTIWFAAASALTPAAGIALGTINLRIVGLENFAVLSLAGFYYVMALGYSDFGSQSHLLAAFAKKSPRREQDLGNVLALRALVLVGILLVLVVFARLRPRQDDLYVLLGLYLMASPSHPCSWSGTSMRAGTMRPCSRPGASCYPARLP